MTLCLASCLVTKETCLEAEKVIQSGGGYTCKMDQSGGSFSCNRDTQRSGTCVKIVKVVP